MTIHSYEDYTVKNLKVAAKTRKVTSYYKLNKTQLVAALTRLDKLEATARNTVTTTPTNAVKYNNVKFGRKIDSPAITAYVAEFWGGVFTVSNVSYDGHYWTGTVLHTASGMLATGHRMDYLIGYMRAPRKFAKLEDVKEARELVVL
jgi:hypothetical protein